MKNVSQDRIEWIDIYKGLAIILVVLFLSTKLRTDPRAIKNKFLLLGLTISSLWAFLLLNHPSGYDQIQ